MEVESSQLMTAVKAGDRDAFDTLVATLRSRAFFVAHSLVGSREDAMDMTQEAFMKTFRARETFRDGEPFLPWFHRILRNTCFSFLRKHKRPQVRHSLTGDDRRRRDNDWELEGEEPTARRAARSTASSTACSGKRFTGSPSATARSSACATSRVCRTRRSRTRSPSPKAP